MIANLTTSQDWKTRGVWHTVVALPLTLKKKSIFKAKEELWKLKYFTIAKII